MPQVHVQAKSVKYCLRLVVKSFHLLKSAPRISFCRFFRQVERTFIHLIVLSHIHFRAQTSQPYLSGVESSQNDRENITSKDLHIESIIITLI